MSPTLLVAIFTASASTDLLPDSIVWDKYLASAYVGVTRSDEPPAGRKALRFDTVTACVGVGPLHLLGRIVNGQQEVYQIIHRSDGTTYERLAGVFVYHDGHQHMHFENWTHFRLREYLADGGIGAVVRTGGKMSFCITETHVYDSSMPGFSDSWGAFPLGCGQEQGTRPGRADRYHATLSGQYIDIEGLPDGDYWLEGEVDPENRVVESDETNNVSRVKVHIGPVPPASPDRYEENDSKAQVDARQEGGVNSPNLGLVNARREIAELSMDDAEDWFRFRLHGNGGAGDYIRVESIYHAGQTLDLYLLDSNGNVLASDTQDSLSIRQVSLKGRGPGYFYAKVVRDTGSNPNYMLTVEPDGNLPPNIDVTSPPEGDLLLERAWELVPVKWLSNDPEGDPKTVSLFIDRNPNPGDSNIPVEGYQDLPGSDREANLLTNGMALGKWYVIARGWDGGAYGYGVSPGTFTLYKKGDINFDGWLTFSDYSQVVIALLRGNLLPSAWRVICDMDRDHDFDLDDLRYMRDHLERP